MSNHKSVRQLWNASRGLVFKSGGPTAHSQVPVVRYSSSPPGMGPASTPAIQDDSLSSGGLAENEHRVPGLKPSFGKLESRQAGTMQQYAAAANPSPSTSLQRDNSTVHETPDKKPRLKNGRQYKPPYTPLDFKIPQEVFNEAKKAKRGTPESFWKYNLYRGSGDDSNSTVKVKVHYCKSSHTAERVLKEHFLNEKVLGFDLEWQPSVTAAQGPRRNVSLVQLSSPSRIALLHLALFPKNDELATPTLKKIMEDPEVTKVGVWIKGDCNRLRTYLGIDTRGSFELSHLYRLVKYSTSGELESVNRKLVSLATQVEEYLGLPIFKELHVRISDWTQPLSMDQIMCKSNPWS